MVGNILFLIRNFERKKLETLTEFRVVVFLKKIFFFFLIFIFEICAQIHSPILDKICWN